MEYHPVFLGDDDAEVEEKRSGVIIPSLKMAKKLYQKNENGKSVIWTISSDMEMAGITRYTAECTDVTLSGEITFQKGRYIGGTTGT